MKKKIETVSVKNVTKKKSDAMGLWKNLNFMPMGDDHFSLTAAGLGATALIRDILEKEVGHLTEYMQEGYVKQEAATADEPMQSMSEKYAKHFEGLGGRLVYKLLSPRGDTCIYLWKDGVVETSLGNDYLSVRSFSHNEQFLRDIRDYLDSHWKTVERTGHIYAIVRQSMHLGLSSIGNAGIPLVEGNYTPKVMEDYKYVIRDLKSESPSGRISIMRGPAGTGKTHLIRAMLLEVPDAMFVLISPEVVTTLAGPELLPLLMNYRGSTTGPIVLVLEDADKCLVARENTDMNSIQALLNLGDGILGSLLDMRIVATTNADEFKMDAAITRPGRLSKMLDVNSLDLTTAQKIFDRLLPDASVPKELVENPHVAFKMSLAEVYALARKYGWTPALRKKAEDKVVESSEPEEDDDLFG
jgi:hypothetical protein